MTTLKKLGGKPTRVNGRRSMKPRNIASRKLKGR